MSGVKAAFKPRSLMEIATKIRVEPDMCETCVARTMADIERATVEFLESHREPERECGRCHVSRTDVGPAGLCGLCLEKIQKGEFLAEKIHLLPEGLRQASFEKMEDVENTAWVKSQLIAAAEQRGIVYLWGKRGCGKTTSLAAIYRGMAYRQVNVHWSTQRSALAAINDDPAMAEIYARRACAGALFLDELGEAPAARWYAASLSALVDALYLWRRHACVFIASNYDLDGLKRELSAPVWGLDTEGPGRITSRLFQMCMEIHNESPDMRLR